MSETINTVKQFLEFNSDYYESKEPTTIEDIYNLSRVFCIYFNTYPICSISYYLGDDLYPDKPFKKQTVIVDYDAHTKEMIMDLLFSIQNMPQFKFFLIAKEARDYINNN